MFLFDIFDVLVAGNFQFRHSYPANWSKFVSYIDAKELNTLLGKKNIRFGLKLYGAMYICLATDYKTD